MLSGNRVCKMWGASNLVRGRWNERGSALETGFATSNTRGTLVVAMDNQCLMVLVPAADHLSNVLDVHLWARWWFSGHFLLPFCIGQARAQRAIAWCYRCATPRTDEVQPCSHRASRRMLMASPPRGPHNSLSSVSLSLTAFPPSSPQSFRAAASAAASAVPLTPDRAVCSEIPPSSTSPPSVFATTSPSFSAFVIASSSAGFPQYSSLDVTL